MIHFVHAADIHLDSPLKGLVQDELFHDVSEIRNGSRRAVINMVDLCIAEQVPILIISGDLYDGDWKDFSTGLFFVQQMQRLAEHNIKVAVIRGNHDAANKMTRTLVLPDNVKVFSSKNAETWLLDESGLALHGQSYAKQAVTENLAISYPEPVDGYTNIGILHCLLTGSEGHQPYAPCTPQDLINKRYNYWALGHVHTHQIISHNPPIVYPGCLQGRNIKETGAKGCVIVKGESPTELTVTFHPLDVVRWYNIEVDVSGVTAFSGILNRLEEELQKLSRELELVLCLRISFTGVCSIHGQLLADQAELQANCHASAIQVLGPRIMIQKVSLQTQSDLDIKALGQSDSPQGELIRLLDDLNDGDWAEELELDFSSLKTKLAQIDLKVEPDQDLLRNSRDLLLQELAKTHLDEK